MIDPLHRAEQNSADTPPTAITLLESAARELGVYDGPPLAPLPPIVQERLTTLFGEALLLSRSHPLANCISCTVEQSGAGLRNTKATQEAIHYQYEFDLPYHEIVPDEYHYAAPDIHITITLRDRALDSTSNTNVAAAEKLRWPKEFMDLFRDANHEAIGTYHSYQIIAASRLLPS